MDWEAIGAIGEIIGAGAVVVSLLYLASQVRTQNKEARLAAMHQITVGYRDSLATFTDEGLTNLVMKANDDFESLTDGEAMRLISATQRILRVGEEAYIQYEEGRLEQRMWEPIAKQYAAYLSIPAFARVWEIRRQNYDTNFSQFMDDLERPELTLR
jgi:hypothetical protein